MALLGDETFDEYWSSTLVFAVGARIALRSGQNSTASDNWREQRACVRC